MYQRISFGFIVICSVSSFENHPCSKSLSIDITTGTRSGNKYIFENMTFEKNQYFMEGGIIWGCICQVRNCIRRCCSENSELNYPALGCVKKDLKPLFKFYNNSEVYLTSDSSDYFVVSGHPCVSNDQIFSHEIDDYFIQKNGSLYSSVSNTSHSIYTYCLVHKLGLVCLNTSESNTQSNVESKYVTYIRIIQSVGMIISMPFLLLTFLVYLLLPERNLHRRALMSYVFTLLAAYITLVTIQLYSGQFPDTTCHVLGYLIIFFFLVSFFWMNVMCVDMWLAFSGMRTFLSKKTAERKRFIIYCIYAWGMPIVHVLIVFLINHYGSTDTSWNPQIGVKRCFLGEGMPTFYYFYLPMAILIGINITLFVLTTVRIQKIKKETSMLKQTDSRRHTYEDDKQKFNLYLKLMFAMGVNWITELVSWAVDYAFSETPAYVWYITDFTNAMYGVLIFLIFVFKKKIWRSLKKKYYICIGKPHLAHSMTTSSARGTRTSNYSTTDTTAVSTDYRLSDMKNGKIPEESALNRT
ncbi:G-protein coupled receptor Mth2-like isoform X6 [Diabrotica virgifera virgifera]|uniref:G-protein coupled receptor Mth2-like n=1 Tax=Diabrotica virgifera virgifera TaxID=50390 RepID=A0ABM5KWV7_DIAVI|nr:G-protein coupled receptor Mth2-like isoform X6 [Diabrotica virgifera virgifera]